MQAMNWLGRAMLLLGITAMTGCLFTVDSDRDSGGSQWSDQELARIQPGQTTESWVRTTFGEPKRRTEYEDGSSVWHYENTSRVDTEVGLFLLFHIDVESREEQHLAVEMKDAVVSDYWVETRRH